MATRTAGRLNIHVQGWLMVLPAMVLLAAFTHLPVVTTFIDSFFSTPRAGHPAHFIGVQRYGDMAADPIFWQALTNNLLYALITVPVSIGLALAMAIWVSGRIPGRAMLRLAFFMPTVLPMIAAANIWLFFYTPGYGLLDQIAHLFGFGSTNWLGDTSTALPSLMAVTIWKESGFFMIFFLAALQQVPPDLYEAARIENATRWQVFARSTWPLGMPTTLFVAINELINAFRIVDEVWMLTGGGPGSATRYIGLYIWRVVFPKTDYGFGSAASLLTLYFTIVICWLLYSALIARRSTRRIG